jgi:hypothetical protein
MLFKSNLNEIVILIAGMVYVVSEVLIFFTPDMQTEFSFTVGALCWVRKPSALFTLYWQVTILLGVIQLLHVFIHKEYNVFCFV